MEQGSTYAKIMIENLLSIYALTNMHRSSGRDEHRTTALAWIPKLESQLASLKEELTKDTSY